MINIVLGVRRLSSVREERVFFFSILVICKYSSKRENDATDIASFIFKGLKKCLTFIWLKKKWHFLLNI